MVRQFKNLMLNQYLNFRLNYFRSNEDLCDYSAKIGTVKKILLILPAECKDKTEYRNFINGLNKIFQKAKISTFQIKDLRLHEQNWLGVPNESYLDELRSQNFDLIIDLNNEPDKICAYICALSEAPLRINLISGPYDHAYNLYFSSEQEKSPEERHQLILSNLTKLKLI